MIRIVELINSLDKRGGAEVFFSNLCIELKKRKDVELLIISLFDNIDDSFNFLKEKPFNMVTCHKKRKIDFKSSRILKKLIKDFDPDIINTHLGTITSYYLAFGTKKRKWNIVHTVHNIADKEATKYDLIVRRPYIKKDTLSFIGISDQITKSIVDLHGKCRTTTVFNGIPLKEIRKDKKTITFVCPARYSEAKNHRMLFNVFSKLTNEYKYIELHCFGKGDIITEYQKYINNLHCDKHIFLHSQVDDIYPQLFQSKFFVLSSLYEGNPISILEALNCGVPCVVPATGGIPDVIKDGENGFLFVTGDEDSMLLKMKQALDYSNYEELSKRCIGSVSKYSIENTVNEYLDYFNQIKNGGVL